MTKVLKHRSILYKTLVVTLLWLFLYFLKIIQIIDCSKLVLKLNAIYLFKCHALLTRELKQDETVGRHLGFLSTADPCRVVVNMSIPFSNEFMNKRTYLWHRILITGSM